LIGHYQTASDGSTKQAALQADEGPQWVNS